MEFEWDEAKSEACFQARGFDFAHAARAFYDPKRLVETDARRDYGEDRLRLLGSIDGRLYVVVYTPKPHAVRIISARKANPREVKRYETRTHED